MQPIRCAAFLLFFQASLLWAEDKTVRIGLDEWPPFAGEAIPGQGMSAEIIRQVYEHEGYQQDIKHHRLDVMGNLYEMDSIKAYAIYSQPYYISEVKFMARQNFTGELANLEAAKAYKIGLGNGYSFGEVFDNANYLNKRTCPLTAGCVRMLLAGRIDLVIDSEEVLHFLQKDLAKVPAGSTRILPLVVIKNNMAIGVAKTHPKQAQLIADFNRGLSYLKSSGKLDRIIKSFRTD